MPAAPAPIMATLFLVRISAIVKTRLSVDAIEHETKGSRLRII